MTFELLKKEIGISVFIATEVEIHNMKLPICIIISYC